MILSIIFIIFYVLVIGIFIFYFTLADTEADGWIGDVSRQLFENVPAIIAKVLSACMVFLFQLLFPFKIALTERILSRENGHILKLKIYTTTYSTKEIRCCNLRT